MKRLWILLTCCLWGQLGLSAPSVSVDYRFEDAATHKVDQGKASVDLPKGSVSFTDSKMDKTLQVIALANLISTSLDDYEKASCIYPATGICNFPETDATANGPVCEPRLRVAEELEGQIQTFQLALTGDSATDAQITEAMKLSEKLVSNMKNHAVPSRICEGFPEHEPVFDGSAASPSAGGSPVFVTAGGAQNYGFFKKVVEAGDVPSSLVVEGFMSEFDLSLAGEPCKKLICVFPEAAVIGDRLFVQVGLSSKETTEEFKRKPLNLAIVLDISGSMAATNNTHQSRLDWAKDALAATVAKLNEKDVLSIVIFDSDSAVLLEPTAVKDKAKIYDMIEKIQTQGSTNLEAGLRDGYALVSKNLKPKHENRVILISDAGLNTGITNTSEILRLVTDNAADGIGLTAIGMGSNFQEDFIHAISRSRGGNYIFVQTGEELSSYFDRFNYLVTPIAYGFRANLKLDDVNGKLVKTYGIPQSPNASAQELFDIQTLFFSNQGGGAIVLEYQLEQE